MSASTPLNFKQKNELRILKSLDIPNKFIFDPLYVSMKEDISPVTIHYFSKDLKQADVIVHTLEEMVSNSGIPNSFLYLSMIESRFLTTAKSDKSAAGLWQFMPKTAKQFNLTITNKIDERLDPIKSTKTAIKYLKYLKKRFHKWYLVAMAYNCGEGRLARTIERVGSDNIFALLNHRRSNLPRETKVYIRKLILASLVANSTALLAQHKPSKKNILKQLQVKKGTALKDIATSYKMSLKTLQQYNAHILKGITPKGKKKYCIYIPEDKINKATSICSTNKNVFIYTVEPKDTLYSISKRFNTSIDEIEKLNKNITANLIAGKKIALIGKAKKAFKQDIKESTTILHIAQLQKNEKIKIKKPHIKDNNKIKTTKIQVKKLNKQTAEENTFTYTVKKGESLYDISRKFNNRISTLVRLNGVKTKNLTIGRLLTIKR